jgi:hypothetical protein
VTKEYLGDSVYIDWDGQYAILTTENGEGPSNTIYLEPAVQVALVKWFEELVAGKKTPTPTAREVVVHSYYSCNGSPTGCDGARFGGCAYCDDPERQP